MRDGDDWSERLSLRAARDPRRPDGPFIHRDQFAFIHTPKVGGTSFYWFLTTFFKGAEILPSRRQLALPADWGAEAWTKHRFFHGVLAYDQVADLHGRAHFVTLLRDPVRRAISNYWYYRRPSFFADAYPEELAAVRRVRSFVRSRALGVVARIAPEDLAYTFALVFGANTGDLRPLDAAWRWLGPPAFAPYEADDTDDADAGRTARRARSTARLRVA